MSTAHTNAVLQSAVPHLRAAIRRFESRGDFHSANRARLALAIAQQRPAARAFADPPIPGGPAGGDSDDAVLQTAHDHLVMKFAEAKQNGDGETVAKLEPYLRSQGILPEMPALDHMASKGAPAPQKRPLTDTERAMLEKTPMGRQLLSEYAQ